MKFLIGSLCCFLLGLPTTAWASHKCPKPPNKGGFFGLFVTTTYLPIASVMAFTRSSNTSGCGQGHASDSFYTPKRKRVKLYLDEMFDYVVEESAQGQGVHLEALAMLAGCPHPMIPLFSQELQAHHERLFSSVQSLSPQDKVWQLSGEILAIVEKQPLLVKQCGAQG